MIIECKSESPYERIFKLPILVCVPYLNTRWCVPYEQDGPGRLWGVNLYYFHFESLFWQFRQGVSSIHLQNSRFSFVFSKWLKFMKRWNKRVKLESCLLSRLALQWIRSTRGYFLTWIAKSVCTLRSQSPDCDVCCPPCLTLTKILYL